MTTTVALLWAAVASVQAPAILEHAHAHNDYTHGRPLLDALDHGLCSVEADVWFVDGAVLVAHDRADCEPSRTLRALYLEPLAARIRANGGRVHRDGPLEFQLLIDFKSGGAPTWAAVKAELDAFPDLFTTFTANDRTPGPVLAVLSGSAPDDLVLAEPLRRCACDGWFGDVTDASHPTDHPLLSASWTDHFQWMGHGPFPAEERARLRDFVRRAHSAGRKLRFWGVPNRQTIWREELDAGVDWLNVDNLPGIARFFADRARDHELRDAIDAWLDTRPGTTAATDALLEQLTAAGTDAAALEALLRAGPRRLADPGLATGKVHTDVPLQCGHVDYATRYFLRLPKQFDPATPHALLVVGHGGNGAMDVGYARRAAAGGFRPWIEVADAHGMIVAAPLTERGWGAIGNSIVLSLIAKLSREYRIDPDRVYLTGHSMGGHLTWRSALTMGDRFAAVSPMSGGYDYVERGQMPLLWSVPGYATFGASEPYSIDEFNRKMRAWVDERRFPWQIVEKPGGHEIFADELPKIGAFFASHPRDPFPTTVWAQGGRTLQWDTADANERWGVTHHWDPARPIPFGVFHWLRLIPAPQLADGATQRVRGDVDRAANTITLVAENARRVRLHLHPRLVDFTRPLRVVANERTVFEGAISPDLRTMLSIVHEFDDRGRIVWATLDVAIDGDHHVEEPRGS